MHTAYFTCKQTCNTSTNAHCTLHTAHCTLYTAHCTLHTTHWTLDTGHCTLHTSHCTLHTANVTLHTANYTLPAAHVALNTVICSLHTFHCRSADRRDSGSYSCVLENSQGAGKSHQAAQLDVQYRPKVQNWSAMRCTQPHYTDEPRSQLVSSLLLH